jgi:peptide/nickel transport system substrate-binding protein
VKDGQRLELTLLVSKKVLNDALIPIAKENWQQIGVCSNRRWSISTP